MSEAQETLMSFTIPIVSLFVHHGRPTPRFDHVGADGKLLGVD